MINKRFVLFLSVLVGFSIVFLSRYSTILIVNVILSLFASAWLYYGILLGFSYIFKQKTSFKELEINNVFVRKDVKGDPPKIPSIEITIDQDIDSRNYYGFCIKPEEEYYRLLLPFASSKGHRVLTIFSDVILASFTSANKNSVFENQYLKLYVVQIPQDLEVLDDFTTSKNVEEIMVKYPYVQ